LFAISKKTGFSVRQNCQTLAVEKFVSLLIPRSLDNGENGNALQAQLFDLVNLAVFARQTGQVTLLTLIKISSARPAWFDHSLNL
jgi:hypothetical protein